MSNDAANGRSCSLAWRRRVCCAWPKKSMDLGLVSGAGYTSGKRSWPTGDLMHPMFRLLLLTATLGVQMACTPAKVRVANTGTDQSNRKEIVRAGYHDVRHKIIPLIKKIRQKYKVEGLSLALVDRQGIAWAEGFGYSNEAKRISATPNTIYRAGSIAKSFTASAVMQLVEDGVVQLDRPLSTYLPQFSIRSRFRTTSNAITVRSIMHHHSGLPTDIRKGMWTSADFTSVTKQLHEEYAAYPPNMLFSYSNVGYSLLGHMLQERSGRPFSDYMQQELFQPLGMHNTSFTLTQDMQPLISKGYRDGSEVELHPIRDLPAYSIYSSVMDLGQYMNMLLADGSYGGREILEQETIAEMFKVQNGNVALDMGIKCGLGWFIEQGSVEGANNVVRHGGTTMLFSSEMILLPEHHLGVVVLANTKGSRKVVSRLAERVLQAALEEGKGDAGGFAIAGGVGTGRQKNGYSTTIAQGSYATELGLLVIRPEENKLCACATGIDLDLVAFPDGWIGVSSESAEDLPSSYKPLADMQLSTRSINQREVIVARRKNKDFLLGEKIKPSTISQTWLQRTGRYEIINPDSEFPMEDVQVDYQHGILSMSFRMPELSKKYITIPLQPISETKAVILGLGRMRGDILQVVMVDGEECLRYSGYIVRKVSS